MLEALKGWTCPSRNMWFAASYLGWTLDAFDYFVLVFVMRDIAREFNVAVEDRFYDRHGSDIGLGGRSAPSSSAVSPTVSAAVRFS